MLSPQQGFHNIICFIQRILFYEGHSIGSLGQVQSLSDFDVWLGHPLSVLW
jgi:hypothetical protein